MINFKRYEALGNVIYFGGAVIPLDSVTDILPVDCGNGVGFYVVVEIVGGVAVSSRTFERKDEMRCILLKLTNAKLAYDKARRETMENSACQTLDASAHT